MKKSIAILSLFAMLFVSSGCASASRLNVLGVAAGVDTRAHEWVEPHFTADLESNPISVEIGAGFVTVGANAGLADAADWVDLSVKVGPDK